MSPHSTIYLSFVSDKVNNKNNIFITILGTDQTPSKGIRLSWDSRENNGHFFLINLRRFSTTRHLSTESTLRRISIQLFLSRARLFYCLNWIVFHFIPHGSSEDKRKKSRARQKKLNGTAFASSWLERIKDLFKFHNRISLSAKKKSRCVNPAFHVPNLMQMSKILCVLRSSAHKKFDVWTRP